MSDVWMERTLSGCAAADDAAQEYLRRWPIGEKRKANVRRPRVQRTHRRYWALVNLVYQNNEEFKSQDQVHYYLKIRAGHATPMVVKGTGEVLLLPNSIDFDTLGEDEFREVWNRVVQVVSEEILHTGASVIENEIMKVCGLAG